MSDSLPGKPSQAEGDVGDDELSEEEQGAEETVADAPDDRP